MDVALEVDDAAVTLPAQMGGWRRDTRTALLPASLEDVERDRVFVDVEVGLRLHANLLSAEHIGAEATLVDERTEGAGLPRRGRQALEVRARLAQPLAEALDVADPEVLADEGIQVDAAGDDVPPGLFRGEPASREVDALEHLCLDKREVVPAPVGVGEG